jgi:hypothetical protein
MKPAPEIIRPGWVATQGKRDVAASAGVWKEARPADRIADRTAVVLPRVRQAQNGPHLSATPSRCPSGTPGGPTSSRSPATCRGRPSSRGATCSTPPADELLALALRHDVPAAELSHPPQDYIFPGLVLSLWGRDSQYDRKGGQRRPMFGAVGGLGATYLAAVRAASRRQEGTSP